MTSNFHRGVRPLLEPLDVDDLPEGIAVKAIKRRAARVQIGLFGDAKSVGDGVSELRIDLGPGYRVYFARRGDTVVLLSCGGDKAGEDRDIARAKAMAQEWKA